MFHDSSKSLFIVFIQLFNFIQAWKMYCKAFNFCCFRSFIQKMTDRDGPTLEKKHTLYMLKHQHSIVTKMSQEKHRGREKAKMFQTHIYDPELNCLSLCNSQSFLLQAGGEQSARSVILPSVSSYIHPSDLELRFQGLHYRDWRPLVH